MERTILHCDLNNCYASIECLHRPELRDKPVAVGGDVEQRHGIILAKNQIAKGFGIKTGEAIWQAQRKCPQLITLPPNFSLYLRFSAMARKIFLDYTDRVEPFGIDEAWLDITGDDGKAVADEIRQRIQFELGITASVGVSFNKIFAKLGSDYKKPNATTVISSTGFQEIVWPLPAGDLLYVGSATRRKLSGVGVLTIGDIARADPWLLQHLLGKWGEVIQTFAKGEDVSPVARFDDLMVIKSIGNSTTTPRDLETDEDVKLVLWVLAESVAARMREQGFVGKTVCLSLRDNQLMGMTRQGKLPCPTDLATEITTKAFSIFQNSYQWARPLRSIGLSVTDFSHDDIPIQLDLFHDDIRRTKLGKIETAVDDLRRRFGHYTIQRASLLQDTSLTHFAPKDDHTIHPRNFF